MDSLMFVFFLLALLLLCPRCKYLAGAELARLAAAQPHAASRQGLSHRLFHGCSPLLPTHHIVSCCCFLACLFKGHDKGISIFLGKRALPLLQAVIFLCLIHKEASQQEHNCFHWLLTGFECNKMTKRGEILISSSLSSPCLRVTLGGQFSWRKERATLSLASGMRQKRLLKSSASTD